MLAARAARAKWRRSPAAVADSEPVNETRVPEQPVQKAPISAQTAAMARAMARICNDERRRLGGMSGHVGFAFTGSQSSTGSGSSRMPKRPYTLSWMARASVTTSAPMASPRLTSTSACFS